ENSQASAVSFRQSYPSIPELPQRIEQFGIFSSDPAQTASISDSGEEKRAEESDPSARSFDFQYCSPEPLPESSLSVAARIRSGCHSSFRRTAEPLICPSRESRRNSVAQNLKMPRRSATEAPDTPLESPKENFPSKPAFRSFAPERQLKTGMCLLSEEPESS
ncbi:MAG: hypothetical protein ACK58T_34730, partial [Phycisphaerae bacterium]